MEANEWDAILQFVADGLAQDAAPSTDKPASSIVRPPLSRTVSAAQIPTPPVRDPLLWLHKASILPSQNSVHGTQAEEREQMIISVSTTFFPGAELDVLPTDLIILSSDSVFFYVHTHKILAASANGFNTLLPLKQQTQPEEAGSILPLNHDSVVLNILLHTIYNMSAAHYAPTPETIIAAVESLEKYGLSVQTYLAPASPFYTLFLGTAPQAPIDFYAISGAYDLLHLAIPISSFLLSYSLASLTDELAVKMGPLYLKRLFFLHLGRIEALKRLLLPPPQPHVPTANCDFTEQKKLTRAWALASAYLAWDVRPDLSTHAIEAALRPLGDYLACDQCTQLLRERINNLVAQWSKVKVSYLYPYLSYFT
ncbi:hypothetical protein BJV74DRAFT_777565 [Russula compacta]|nr:hypothetical protein BJV74DRAFT_777565 [Russula compacta]